MSSKIRQQRGKGGQTRAFEAQPLLRQRSTEIQPFGTVVDYQLVLSSKARALSVGALNQILTDTLVLRDLYKKHHWQVSGPTFYQLHLLFDKHFKEQSALIDMLGERVQTLGGIAVAMAHDVVEMTRIERPARGREQVPVQISRLLDAHEVVIADTREALKVTAQSDDAGTADLLMGDVLRTNEMHVWFLSEHLVDTPLVRAT
ncbi:DNA polymerase [Sorangium cellulosum]|uniref:DNA polymerase n=1 Tax=Sorangium cellulosum TaxID=56 RepID=A0A4P2R3G4_SORCE|nr:DNA starvation/stationary phase protection protein [Sorangium cellulosum]AUX37131.1 DNA polymerase [Sorangium cellulosum]WCQ96421.1 DNA binding protein [Sorangium sp. Soce836]